MDYLSDLEKRISDMQKKYSKYLQGRESKRRKQMDVFLTSKDERVLTKSFIIGRLIDGGIRKILGIASKNTKPKKK